MGNKVQEKEIEIIWLKTNNLICNKITLPNKIYLTGLGLKTREARIFQALVPLRL